MAGASTLQSTLGTTRPKSQSAVREALDAVYLGYREIRNAAGLDDLISDLKIYYERKTKEEAKTRISSSTVKIKIQKQGTNYFEKSTEEDRERWEHKDWICWAVLRIIRLQVSPSVFWSR